jgi:hypothetical protein
MNITEEKARIYDILLNMFIKLLAALSSIAAFWFILFRLFDYTLPPLQTKVLAIVDAILGGTMFVIIAFYFPAFKAASKTTRTKKTI